MTQESFNIWLTSIINTEKPPSSIVAWYFGIITTSDGYKVHLAGSEAFDEEDEDWACNTDFVPEDNYFTLGEPGKDWEDVLEEVESLIKTFKQTHAFKGSFLAKAAAIATGFDDGDLILIK